MTKNNPRYKTWHKTIQAFLEHDDRVFLSIGERSQKWINSFQKDLERWGFKVKLNIVNPVLVQGKVPVELEKI